MKKWVGRLNIIKMSILSSSSNKKKSSFQVILNYYTKVNDQGYFEELYLGVGETRSTIYQDGIKL